MMDPTPLPPRQQPPDTSISTFDAQNGNFSCPNDTNRGSIAERRAAKCGFNAERINTARFRTNSPLPSPSAAAVLSPFITLSPGISPAALLDSPIMLPNCQPSPTTGSFPFLNYGSSVVNNTVTIEDVDKGGDAAAASLKFKPHNAIAATLEEDQANNPTEFQEIGSVEQPMDFEFPVEFSKEPPTERFAEDSAIDVKVLNSMVANANFSDVQMDHADRDSNRSSSQMESVPGENVELHHPLVEERGTFPEAGIVRNSEDGYSWRKYGQKQVKGSEYPRSYYKCTHPNCQVKKKIERSHDGQITEIIYKGTHNHPKPQLSRRAQVGSTYSFDEVSEMDEGSGTCVKNEVGCLWKNSQAGCKDVKFGSDWKADGLERTSSTSVITELSDRLSTTQGKSMLTFESAGTPELSSTLVSNDDDDDGATQGSISLGVDADIEESESKRRKIESCLVETNLSSRAVREPRVVVQIESEVDILDDGYRWRKYGQKVVKGNPNPRSYYKCTSPGCSVRKHVERASHNLKYVITTYEGKHNHEVPAAKKSNCLILSGSNLSQVTTNPHTTLTISRNSSRTKPETHVQGYALGFDRKPVLNNDFSRSCFPGNFSNEMKLQTSSIYPLKFPPFQHTMPYSSLEFSHSATLHSGSIASLVPDFQIPLPTSLHASGNLSLAGVDFNYSGKNVSQGQPFLSGHQLVLPKQEQRDDHFDTGQAPVDCLNGSLLSSVYQRNFPS